MNEPNSDLLGRIKNHIEQMSPGLKGYWQGGLLLGEAFEEIKALKKQIADMEKAFLLTKTYHD